MNDGERGLGSAALERSPKFLVKRMPVLDVVAENQC